MLKFVSTYLISLVRFLIYVKIMFLCFGSKHTFYPYICKQYMLFVQFNNNIVYG